MDSASNSIPKSNILSKIGDDENMNDLFTEGCFNKSRNELILWYFEVFSEEKVGQRLKEKSIFLLDRMSSAVIKFELFFLKIFLVSLLNLVSKLEFYAIKEEFNIDSVIQHFNARSENAPVCRKDIFLGEVFICNNLGWTFATVTYTDMTHYFISNYLLGIFNHIDKLLFFKFADYFIECALCAFETDVTSIHSVSLAIILLTWDQIKANSNIHYMDKTSSAVDKMIISFLRLIHWKLNIDLMRLNIYKQLLTQYNKTQNVKKILSQCPDLLVSLALNCENNSLVNDSDGYFSDRSLKKKHFQIIKEFKDASFGTDKIVIRKNTSLSNLKPKYKEDERKL